MNELYLDCLRAAFVQRGDHPALVYHGQPLSYATLHGRVRRLAGWFQERRLGTGDRVALCTPHKLGFLTAHLGTLFAGGVSLPLNPRFTRDELRFFLRDSGARLAIVGEEQRCLFESLRPDLPELEEIVADTDALDAPDHSWREPVAAAGDPCLIVYSSGTTGWPKGIVHNQANVASSLLALQDCWHISAADVVVNVLPLFHVHGLCFATLLTLLAGGCILLEDVFHPQQTLEVIGRGTVFMAVPTIYYRLLETPEFRQAARSWSNVRLFTCGSAPIRPEVLPELEGILGQPIINRYGMTEAFVITSLPVTNDRAKRGSWPHGSVGLPLKGVEVDIRREDGQSCAAGEVGAIRLRGPNLFREYWRQPEATRAAFASGWFDTGDLGFRDAAGFLTLVGRKNDLIITNGYNVYPQVVERVVNDCPGVRESAVLGLPDSRRGECVAVAVVRSDPTLDEVRLRAWWDERLVDYQRPRLILFLEALPRNAMGKVLRGELRTRFPSA